MTTQISIRIPRETVTPKEFAELEGIKVCTVYAWCSKGLLPIKSKNNAHGRTRIHYAQYKQKSMAEALGHSRFEIIIGA